jgi:hypothetical protein
MILHDDYTIHKCWAMDDPDEYIKYNHRTKLWTYYGIKKRLKDLNYCHKCGESLDELGTSIKAKIEKDNCKHTCIMIALWTKFQGKNKDTGTFTKPLFEYVCHYCGKVMFVDEYNNDYVIKTSPFGFA